MRISAHNRNIETGRFYNLDRHERVCSMCNLNVVEEKIYMVNILRYPDIMKTIFKKNISYSTCPV
jgi:hypothetical protein